MPTQPTSNLLLPELISEALPNTVPVMQGLASGRVQGRSGSHHVALHWPAAMTALRSTSKPSDLVAVSDVPGLHVYVSSDALASSRALILPDLLEVMPVAGVLLSIPAPDQLLLLRLDAMVHLDSLPVLLNAHRIALQSAQQPLLPKLLWTNGTIWEAVESHRDTEGAHLTPGRGLRAALEHLASLGWSPAQAALG